MAGEPAVPDAGAARPAVVWLLAAGLAIARDSLARALPAWWPCIEALGYLCLVALSLAAIRGAGLRASDLGLGAVDPRLRIVGCVILTTVFAAPVAGRAMRWERPDAMWLTLAAPPIEELLCRGVLFGMVARRGHVGTAVVASAVAFATMHAAAHPPSELAAALAAGLVLGAWRALSRDLVAPTVGHLAADVAASFLM